MASVINEASLLKDSIEGLMQLGWSEKDAREALDEDQMAYIVTAMFRAQESILEGMTK